MTNIGECDRCGKRIIAKPGSEFLTIKATNYEWDQGVFSVIYTLCSDCKRSYELWVKQGSPFPR